MFFLSKLILGLYIFVGVAYSAIIDDWVSPSKIKTEPVDGVVMNGESAILECVFDAPAGSCYWEKDGEVLEIEGRYEFIGEHDEGNCTIRINNVNFRDDGNWRCGFPQTSTSPSIKSKSANLTIGVTPLDPVIAFDGVAIEKGDRVYLITQEDVRKLTCWSEDGSPAASLQWKINGIVHSGQLDVVVSTKSSRLRIAKLSAYFTARKDFQQQKLYCEAIHTSYKTPRNTFVRLLVRNENF